MTQRRDYIKIGALQCTETMITFEKILEDGRASQQVGLGDKSEKRKEWEEKVFLKGIRTSQCLYTCIKQDMKYNGAFHPS